MRRLEWSPDALEDLDVIWMYIAEDSVERASAFVEELQAQARKLIDAPRTEMPKACIYAGFRHLFYKMALLWLYLCTE